MARWSSTARSGATAAIATMTGCWSCAPSRSWKPGRIGSAGPSARSRSTSAATRNTCPTPRNTGTAPPSSWARPSTNHAVSCSIPRATSLMTLCHELAHLFTGQDHTEALGPDLCGPRCLGQSAALRSSAHDQGRKKSPSPSEPLDCERGIALVPGASRRDGPDYSPSGPGRLHAPGLRG